MSKTYLDRKNTDIPYIFISYSHVDKDAIEKSLSALSDLGANFWYDKNLHVGDEWLEEVKKVTSNKNCVGILYFISPDFMISQACMDEIQIGESLTRANKNFKIFSMLIGEEDPENYNDFILKSTTYLMVQYPKLALEIVKKLTVASGSFNNDAIYCHTSKSKIDSDEIVKMVFKDVFSRMGCASDETSKLDLLIDNGLVNRNYRLKTSCRVLVELVRGWKVDWKAYSRIGDTISAILVSDELFAAVSRSLSDIAIDYINQSINVSLNNEATTEAKHQKHFVFDKDFLDCVKTDDNGRKIRFLRATEHENYYLQIKEALEMTPISNTIDDGYFFVCDSQGNIDFADRGSEDVYRHINVDAYASIIPVIDIDYNKYKEYLAKRQ